MNLSSLRVYHGPRSWNQTAQHNATVERSLGIRSEHFTYAEVLNPFGLIRLLRNADVINFYAGYTLWPIALKQHRLYNLLAASDVAWLKRLGKKVILHFQGCEIRDRYNPLSQSVCAHCAIRDTYCSPRNSAQRRSRLHKAVAVADAVTVSTPDLISYIDRDEVFFIPKIAPDDVDPFPSRRDPEAALLRVIHAPTSRSIKGTDHIEAVLKKHPEKFELILLEGKSRDEVYEAAESAHLAVDQIRVGWYGNFAVEMMQRGLPVVARTRDDLRRAVLPARVPLIDADESNFEAVMLALHADRSRLADARSAGLKYIRDVHSAKSVGKRLSSIYESI